MTFQVLIADNITVGLTDRGPITSRLNWPIRWITRVSNTINWRDTTHFNSVDDYCRGCRNVSHWQQHFHSGLRSPRRPCLMNLLRKWLLQLGPVAGADLKGRVQRVRTPSPLDDLRFSNTTGILQKKKKKKKKLNYVVYWCWSRARDECTPS